MTTNARDQKALVIAATCNLLKKGDCWHVPSQTGQGKYYVRPEKESCTCPDHQESGFECKHIRAVKIVIQRELFPGGIEVETKTVTLTETVVRKTYPQQWREYNAAQVNEKDHFQTLSATCARDWRSPRSTAARAAVHLLLPENVFQSIERQVIAKLADRTQVRSLLCLGVMQSWDLTQRR